jgi:hypothetical protein
MDQVDLPRGVKRKGGVNGDRGMNDGTAHIIRDEG